MDGLWLILGFIAGLSVCFIDILRLEWFRKRKGIRKISTFWWSIIDIVIVVLVGMLITSLIYVPRDKLRLLAILFVWLAYGLIFRLGGRGQNPEIDIGTVEALRWSWHKAARGGIIGGIVATIFFVSIGLFLRLTDGTMTIVLLVACLILGLIYGLIGLILNGLSREIIETKSIPNQGILLSIRNLIYGGLILGLSIGPFVGVSSGMISGLNDGLAQGAFFGWSFGLMGAFWYGGLDVIQHYTLRLILLIQEHTPANYARFLDYAVDRIFLQKVGGGYRFIHRLLLEHFADMGV